MTGERIAVLDACVLVQAPLRDTLLRLAEPPSLYRPVWSEEIIVEMKRAPRICRSRPNVALVAQNPKYRRSRQLPESTASAEATAT